MPDAPRVDLKDAPAHVGKNGIFLGWVDTVREQKKFQFVVLRNAYGGIQYRLQVIVPAGMVGAGLNQEAYIKVTGLVSQLPDGKYGPDGTTVELQPVAVEVLGPASTVSPDFVQFLHLPDYTFF